MAHVPDLTELPACICMLSNLLTIVCSSADELEHDNPDHPEVKMIAVASREAIRLLQRCGMASETPL